MVNKTKHKQSRKTRTGRKAPRSVVSKARKPVAKEGLVPAQDRFVNDLLVRGEAAKLDSTGKLPLDATHVIEKDNPDGTAVVRRLRYKLF
jgi:hypothetical protein